MEVQEHTPLAPHTTFSIGGNARYFVEARTLDDVQQSIALAQQLHVSVFVLGGGSNTLVHDEGFDGLVIKMSLTQVQIDTEHSTVTAGAGAILRNVIMQSAQKGLSGWAGMYGIPGTIGGAVRGNAGAFGSEMKDVCTGVRAWNSATHEERMFTTEECLFGYRQSFFKKNPEWVILEATLRLTKVSPGEAVAQAEATLVERQKRQIQDIKSAGSFFMNPTVPEAIQKLFEAEKGTPARDGRVPAGWLIDKCGLKGLQEGPVQTGARSANYLINTGGATATEVRATAQKIHDAVYTTFNVDMTPEVAFVDTHGVTPVIHSHV